MSGVPLLVEGLIPPLSTNTLGTLGPRLLRRLRLDSLKAGFHRPGARATRLVRDPALGRSGLWTAAGPSRSAPVSTTGCAAESGASNRFTVREGEEPARVYFGPPLGGLGEARLLGRDVNGVEEPRPPTPGPPPPGPYSPPALTPATGLLASRKGSY